MKVLVCIITALFVLPLSWAHVGEEWHEGHTAHIKLLKTEGYLFAEDVGISIGGIEAKIKGKLTIPVQTDGGFIGEEYYAWGSQQSDDMYEDVGGWECILRSEWNSKLTPAGPATFTYAGQTIVLKDISPKVLFDYQGLMQKIKITYSYKEHGDDSSVLKSVWSEC